MNKTVIDWSKAPEGATHYAIVDGDVVYYRPHGENIHSFLNYMWIQEQGHKSWIMDNIKPIPEKTSMIAPDKLLYTQAQCDAGELPSVGMECMIWFSSSSYKGTITYMGNGVGCYRSKDTDKEYSFSIVSVKFKPLTPPIELIDGEWYLCKKTWGSKETRALHRNQGLWFYDLGQYPDQAEGDYEVISKLLEVKSWAF
jgi:glucan-binding YG repeat protein